jgi:hypothetical protein
MNRVALMTGGDVDIGHANVWHVLGLALFLRILLPVVGYLHTDDVTIFYDSDTASYVVRAHELIAHHRVFCVRNAGDRSNAGLSFAGNPRPAVGSARACHDPAPSRP